MLFRCIPQPFWKDDRFGLSPIIQRYIFVGLVFNVQDNGRIYYDTERLVKALYLDDRAELIYYLIELQHAGLIHTDNGDIVINDWWQFLGVDPSDTIRQQVYSRDDYTCVYCGEPPQHLDHIQAKSRGGKDSLKNLVTSCQSCNIDKKARVWIDWYKQQPFYSPLREEYINRVQVM